VKTDLAGKTVSILGVIPGARSLPSSGWVSSSAPTLTRVASRTRATSDPTATGTSAREQVSRLWTPAPPAAPHRVQGGAAV